MKSYGGITRSYGGITRSYRREREGVGTIGLGGWRGGWRGGWGGGWGRLAILIFLAYPSRPLSPHSTSSQSHPSPLSTSI